MPMKFVSVADYLAALAPEQRKIVDILRGLALNARRGVTEHIKWNAPSFCINGDDRITLGTDTKGRIRVILHRGAKPKDSKGFRFDAPADLVSWPAVDRGVITVESLAMLHAREQEIDDVFRRWMEINL